MPYDIELPDGTLVEIPDGMEPGAARKLIIGKYAGTHGVPSKLGTEGENRRAALTRGVASLMGIVPGVTGFVTGDYANAPLAKTVAKLKEDADKRESPELTYKKFLMDQAIEKAGESGMTAQAYETLKQLVSNPSITGLKMLEMVPDIAATIGTGGVGVLAGRAVATAGKLVAEKAAKKAAKYGTRAAIGQAAIAEGSSTGNEIYAEVYDLERKKGTPEVEAKIIAASAARKGQAAQTGISGLTAAVLPGIEKTFFRPSGAKLLKTALGEGSGEFVEGVSGQGIQNIAANASDQSIPLSRNVGRAGAEGLTLGTLAGGAAGIPSALRANRVQTEADVADYAKRQAEAEALKAQETAAAPPVEEPKVAKPKAPKRADVSALLGELVLNNPDRKGEIDPLIESLENIKGNNKAAKAARAEILTKAEELKASIEESKQQAEAQKQKIDDTVSVANVLDPNATAEAVARSGVTNEPSGTEVTAPDVDARGNLASVDLAGSAARLPDSGEVQAPAPGRVAQSVSNVAATDVGAGSEQPALNVVGFKTEKGSTYVLTPDGKTSRTKQSPGKGQGTTYEPHTAMYVAPGDHTSILSDMQGSMGNASVRLGYVDGANVFKPVQNIAEIPANSRSVVGVFNKKTNGLIGMYEAQTAPQIGMHPVEKLYNSDGTASTHVGNKIVELENKQEPIQGTVNEQAAIPDAAPAVPVTEAQTEAAPNVSSAAEAPVAQAEDGQRESEEKAAAKGKVEEPTELQQRSAFGKQTGAVPVKKGQGLRARINSALGNAVGNKDFGSAVAALQKSSSPIIKWLGDKASTLSGVNVEINPEATASIEKDGKGEVFALYDPKNKTIYSKDADSAKNEGVMGHEVVHALTEKAIDKPNPSQKPIIKSLEKLFSRVKEVLPEAQDYGLTNVKEFVAEGLSNPDFQFKLQKIPYESTTAWGKFAQLIGNLIGVKKEDTTAFMELIALTEGIVEAKPTKAKAKPIEVKLAKPVEAKPAVERFTDAQLAAIDRIKRGIKDIIKYSNDAQGGKLADLTDRIIELEENTPSSAIEVSKEISSIDKAFIKLNNAITNKKAPLPMRGGRNQKNPSFGGETVDVSPPKVEAPKVKEGRKTNAAKEARKQNLRIFTDKPLSFFNRLVTKFQNNLRPIKLLQESMEKAGVLDPTLNLYRAMTLQSRSEAIANEFVTPLINQQKKNLKAYAAAAGQKIEDAYNSIGYYLVALHEPERRATLFYEQKAALTKENETARDELKGKIASEKDPAKAKALYKQLIDLVDNDPDVKAKIEAAKQAGENYLDSDDFMVAGMSTAQIKDINAKMDAAIAKNPKLKPIIDAITSAQRELNTTQMKLEGDAKHAPVYLKNLIDARGWKNYVPFRGLPLVEENVEELDIEDKSGGILSYAEEGAKGRKTAFENVILRSFADTKRAASHITRQELTQIIRNNVDKGYINGKIISKVTFKDQFLKTAAGKLKQGDQYVYHRNDKGEIEVIRIDDRVMSRAIARTYKDVSPLTSYIGEITRRIAQGFTLYNPTFWYNNYFTDMMTNFGFFTAHYGVGAGAKYAAQAAIDFVGQGGVPYKAVNFMRLFNSGRVGELRARAEKDPWYRDAFQYVVDAGGRVSYLSGITTEQQERELGFSTKDKLLRAELAFQKPFSAATDGFELAARVSAFRIARQLPQFKNDLTGAAEFVKELANFEQVGEWGKQAGNLYMFFRPSATGAVRTIDAMMNGKHAKTAAIFYTLLGASAYMVAKALSGMDEEDRNRAEYDDPKRWVSGPRIFFAGYENPMQLRWGFGVGGIASAVAQAMFYADGKQTAGEMIKNLRAITQNSVLPLPLSQMDFWDNPLKASFVSVMPQVARPLLQLAFNQSDLDQKIFKASDNRYTPAYVQNDNIPPYLKSLSRDMQSMMSDAFEGEVPKYIKDLINPAGMQFLLTNYVSGFYKMFNTVEDTLRSAGVGTEDGQKDMEAIWKMVPLRGTAANYDLDRFYKMDDRIKQMAEVQRTLKARDPDEYDNYEEKYPEKIAAVKAYNKAINGSLKDLRKEYNELQANVDKLPPQELKNRKKENRTEQNAEMRAILEEIEAELNP